MPVQPDSTQSEPLFGRGPSSTARLILLGLASILLMMADSRSHYLDRIDTALATLVYPLQEVASWPADTAHWLSETLTSRAQLREENRALTRENLRLHGRLQRFKALKAQNARLRALMNATTDRARRAMIAEIVQIDLAPYSHRILINRGRRDGVYVGQPLIDSHGVMGQVVQVGPVSAYVMLITDPSHALPVQFLGTGLRAIARGTGRPDELQLVGLPLSVNIEVGDRVVTSGLGGRFPPGLPVGRVTSVTRDPGHPFARVIVDAAAALNRTRLALLIWPNDPVPAPESDAEKQPDKTP